jgi:uncharacterized protein (DUF1330 family)
MAQLRWAGDLYAIAQLKFTDRDAYNGYREWAESPECQRFSEDRRAGADTVVLLVKGLPSMER